MPPHATCSPEVIASPNAFDTSVDVSVPVNVANKSYAYVTLLTRDPYLPGVVALLHSLKKTKAKYPVLCVVGADVSKEARAEIEMFGGIVREFDKFLPFPEGTSNSYANPLWIDCWMKLHLWELTEYRKMVYLDADMVVRRNIDHLFEHPQEFLAAQDCYNGGDPEDKARGHYHDPEKCFYSSSCPSKIKPYFNAGFFVFTPSHETANDMKQKSRSMDVTQLTFAEQDFMNEYFKGKWEGHVLPYTYNCIKWFGKYHKNSPYHKDEVHILHYVTEKPWNVGHVDLQDPDNFDHLDHIYDQYDDWIELWEEAMKFRASASGANNWKHISKASAGSVTMFGKEDSFIVAKLCEDSTIEWCYRTMDELKPVREKNRQEKLKLKEQACNNQTIVDATKENCKGRNTDQVGTVRTRIPVCN
ncbi:hypothetical protein GUITHDRAFT_112244 [Guillardia theta CCMP2712]|uniref:Hexosyltransferase n=1 Tax=Guillardia theta (strain CCMP2712) TaxID=905079 RepID=L1J172_GUITC|nr:hypothetical protein GUITHDRAFT_112244 [Guillardia theta CCMP2712]EKX41825.1 hypothetical protein GUITHDRAFT_112244 [Guillardia theta CCMP2712]|eukprot:XP_005828805.1 hypothetical protein GUITHDRAFT_112244 [Guillardia theta CCMP2712]